MTPKIFVFSNVGGGDGPCYAMAQDGTVLGSHWCSHEIYASGDLGVKAGSRPDRHETYKKHYQDGYEMEFVPSSKIDDHALLQEAFALNEKQEKAEEEKAA